MLMFVRFFLGFMLVATSVFLILLVFIQRGHGGGLAVALGGMGCQSAFGNGGLEAAKMVFHRSRMRATKIGHIKYSHQEIYQIREY